MHILIIPSWYPSYPGDVLGVFFREQALALQRHGHQVGVIYPKLKSLRDWKSSFLNDNSLIEECDEGVVTVRTYGVLWIPRNRTVGRLLWVRKGLDAFNAYVQRHGMPEIIHAHSLLNAGVLARKISESTSVPYVVTEHFTGYARGTLSVSEISVARDAAKRASARIAVSQPFCDLLEHVLDGQGGKWIEIPNLVDDRFLEEPLAPKRDIDESFVFINISLLERKKGVHNLLRAFAIAFSGDRSVLLEIGGDGPESKSLQSMASSLGISDQVKFLGRLTREAVLERMSQASALVVSSLHETFGVVVIEALALGKPVVATRSGGPEAIVGDEDGLIVPADDVRALAEAMSSLRRNSKKYPAEEIRRRCSSTYSARSIAKRITDVYVEVVKSKK